MIVYIEFETTCTTVTTVCKKKISLDQWGNIPRKKQRLEKPQLVPIYNGKKTDLQLRSGEIMRKEGY